MQAKQPTTGKKSSKH